MTGGCASSCAAWWGSRRSTTWSRRRGRPRCGAGSPSSARWRGSRSSPGTSRGGRGGPCGDGRTAEVAARPEAVPSTEETLELLELQQHVVRAVRELREPYRTTVLLRYTHGLSVREIAVRTGVSEAGVRQRLKRPRRVARRGGRALRRRLARPAGARGLARSWSGGDEEDDVDRGGHAGRRFGGGAGGLGRAAGRKPQVSPRCTAIGGFTGIEVRSICKLKLGPWPTLPLYLPMLPPRQR